MKDACPPLGGWTMFSPATRGLSEVEWLWAGHFLSGTLVVPVNTSIAEGNLTPF